MQKRREALLDTLESLKGLYNKLWARTSVDIAFQVRTEHIQPSCRWAMAASTACCCCHRLI